MNRLTSVLIAIGAGLLFGVWQENVAAGLFMTGFIIALAVIKTVE